MLAYDSWNNIPYYYTPALSYKHSEGKKIVNHIMRNEQITLRQHIPACIHMTVGTTSPTTPQHKLNGRGPCEPSLTSYYAHHS